MNSGKSSSKEKKNSRDYDKKNKSFAVIQVGVHGAARDDCEKDEERGMNVEELSECSFK